MITLCHRDCVLHEAQSQATETVDCKSVEWYGKNLVCCVKHRKAHSKYPHFKHALGSIHEFKISEHVTFCGYFPTFLYVPRLQPSIQYK